MYVVQIDLGISGLFLFFILQFEKLFCLFQFYLSFRIHSSFIPLFFLDFCARFYHY